MTVRDPELVRLLTQELERHLATLQGRDAALVQRALHALKGSAGLSGERELAAAIQRLERRLRDGDRTALGDAAELVRAAIERLTRGEGAIPVEWPSPPEDLAPVSLDPLVRTQYSAELADRLARIDAALARSDDPTALVHEIYRHVHTIKGAASAVGDEPMGWFCHGLEEWLKAGTGSVDAASTALAEVARWRGVMGGLLEDPSRALETLRAASEPPRALQSSPAAPSRPRPPEPPMRADEATIRVAAQSVDRVLERLAQVGMVEERIAARGVRAKDDARDLRLLRAELAEALRLIGPPRPWGAPAAALRKIERAAGELARMGEVLDAAADEVRAGDHVLREAMRDAKLQLSAMRQTPLKGMFGRLATTVESEARRASRTVVVRTHGADETIDRRVAEGLVEACMTLARNAVAHGIEPSNVREDLGKNPVGTITLSAKKSAGRLVLTIADDGRGVDVEAMRARAVELGAVTEAAAEAADDNTLLALLFLPGFSTRESTDLLAGRGIGLDIAQAAVQRMGGAIRLSSRKGLGFEARVEVPIESGITRVLWVSAGGTEHAIASQNARRVLPAAPRVPHLAACLEPRAFEPGRFTLELATGEDEAPLAVGIDGVGRTEEVLVRPLTPLVAGMGPFAGAIVRGDGSLRLAIDVHALAPRVRALAIA
jgi:two-component system chemotaxis sensor kinase CheA